MHTNASFKYVYYMNRLSPSFQSFHLRWNFCLAPLRCLTRVAFLTHIYINHGKKHPNMHNGKSQMHSKHTQPGSSASCQFLNLKSRHLQLQWLDLQWHDQDKISEITSKQQLQSHTFHSLASRGDRISMFRAFIRAFINEINLKRTAT